MTREVRSVAGRFDVPADGKTLVGYAAVWDTETRITDSLGTFREVVRAGAFARALAGGGDILCCFNHSPSLLLGRSASGTAKFVEDQLGLRFEVLLPDTATGNEVRELVRRGDLRGASFAFDVPPGGDRWKGDFRELLNLNLYEAGPVATPAYTATTVGVRQRGPVDHNEAIRRRLALVLKKPR